MGDKGKTSIKVTIFFQLLQNEDLVLQIYVILGTANILVLVTASYKKRTDVEEVLKLEECV